MYKRQGYEAPTYIVWSASNRSCLVRIPAARGMGTRVELRCPDPTCNPYLETVSYTHLDVYKRQTFDSCLRFLDEDPWDRLRLIRKKCPNTKLQMLFRGQNMLCLLYTSRCV